MFGAEWSGEVVRQAYSTLRIFSSGAQLPLGPQTHTVLNLCLPSERILCAEFGVRQNGGHVLSKKGIEKKYRVDFHMPRA